MRGSFKNNADHVIIFSFFSIFKSVLLSYTMGLKQHDLTMIIETI